jgi:Uma2 family endonuclease
MTTVLSTATERVVPPVEPRFLLRGADWETYQAVGHALSGRHVRLTYDRGNLEFMTISPLHRHLSRLLGRLIVVLTEEFRLPIRSFGDMTCGREDLDRGLEADECFYIVHEPQIRGREEIDLATDPPPDLAVEIEVTRSARDRMAIYSAIEVPEVWRTDGETVTFLRRQPDGRYVSTGTSQYFPGITAAEIAAWLKRRTEMDENSLVEAFRRWVRERAGTS